MTSRPEPPQPALRRSGRYAVTPWAEQHLYRPFIKAAIVVALTLGFTTAVVILTLVASGETIGLAWSTYLQSHGVAQLFGWAGLFITGVAMHVVPRFRGDALIRFPWPQRAILTLVLAGIVFRALGQIAHQSPTSEPLLIASGLALFAGYATFALTLASVLRGGRPSGTPVERWIWAGLAWVLVAAALHLAITVQMAIDGSPVALPRLNEAFILAATFGFVVHFLLGISLRATAGFIRLRPYRQRVEFAAFLLIEAGLLTHTIATVVDWSVRTQQIGLVLLAAGLALFTFSLRILEPPIAPRTGAPGAYPRYPSILIAAYCWLLVGAIAIVGHAGATLDWWSWPVRSSSLGLHIVTLGFITITIIGFASRTLPLFAGRVLHRHWPLDLAFVALSASVALRLLASIDGAPASTRGLALSGALALIALIAFAITIWPLLGDDRRFELSEQLPVLPSSQ
jgi:NnrS protein